ncbi:hypothetical protein BDN70DRAFT_823224 [Pholiota conissans]|uniref:RRM domain-containing protein n=1 Tax=Pholiota conissans TaxID=109636 RepID=A0A9P5ZCW0_9AGAR|nr:hypothetical protein BDN70DRAFT_823224 [Pholiota conissans]
MSYTVNVSNIAPTTTKDHLHDFFTFCGKISAIEFEEKSTKAIISFEKPNAAKTALMLNGGGLDGSILSVTSDVVHQDEERSTSTAPFEQSDKPRAGIAAEYLAKGYELSDHILQRAIEIDSERGISKRFLTYIQNLDKTVGEKTLGPDQTLSAKLQTTVDQATQHARAVDEQKGFSKIAQDYYQKAIASPFGQKVKAFYTTTSKQVKDIHEEARRIADEEHARHAPKEVPAEANSGSAAVPNPTTQAAPTAI